MSAKSFTTHHDRICGTVDVVMIGAGINGIAIAREAAARGLSVVVIERDDLGAGTSAISTRLVHGGLKYLEHFDLRLVIESIRQRSILLKRAPHLVRPYPMLIPFSREHRRPAWLLACGLVLHDVLAVGKPLRRNRIIGPRALRRRWPHLARNGLRWAGLYEDAMVELSERLCVELALDAAQHGARFLTHSEVTSVLREGGHVSGVRYTDAIDRTTKEVQARLVINAAGPWVDAVLDLAGAHQKMIGPTKGSHLVVDAFPGAPDVCVFFESPSDRRPMFVLPWNGRYMIGTTDIPYDGNLDEVATDQAETTYLLTAVNGLFPEAHLTQRDVLWSYSGVRPLPFVGPQTDPSTISRDHTIVVHKGALRGIVSVIGGKPTTHQALGKQVVDTVVGLLGTGDRRSNTRTFDFPGTPATPWSSFREAFIANCVLAPSISARLVDVYGKRAEELVARISDDPALAAVIDEETGAVAAEVVFAVKAEGAQTLEDILLRRTAVALNSDTGFLADRPGVGDHAVASELGQ